MKSTKRLLFLLSVLTTAVLASAQSPKPQHIIVVIQENRTPDNLFQDQNLIANGADIWNINNPFQCENVQGGVQVEPAVLNACFDPNHGHVGINPPNDGWLGTYDFGKMDGACAISINETACGSDGPTYPAVTYVANANGLLDPYFQIAETYGFANYMFQTNQGPSFPAHQFLFSGTSAPDEYNNKYYDWFAAEIPQNPSNGPVGCIAPLDEYALEVNTSGDEYKGYTPPFQGANAGYPCYTHSSLADVLDNVPPPAGPVDWTYYAPPNGADGIWTAPNALSGICPYSPSGNCVSTEWSDHVVVSSAERSILTDIQNCSLAPVSWVIPDGLWSDHPGNYSHDGGPSWVTAIVNAIGGVEPFDQNCGYWNNTVILITWDDWGGFYDHILPYNCESSARGGICLGYPDGQGSAGSQYVYGFRVPLLVVSAYATEHYISGACAGNCPNETQPYIHDFGSILGYIEYVFAAGSEINPSYHYADYYAPDGIPECGSATCPYPLADFFGTTYYPFTAISGAKYPPSCFMQDAQTCFGSNYPSDPDDDEIDAQN